MRRNEIPVSNGSIMLPVEWQKSLQDPTGFYIYCDSLYKFNIPEWLREHRCYFAQQNRGFGEDAFHVLWYWLVNHFRPEKFLEIGVYRGQVLSLVALLQQKIAIPEAVYGISPLTAAGDSVSCYVSMDYLSDVMQNFQIFGLKKPFLIPELSTSDSAKNFISTNIWDMIYIDGNHDYPVVKSDWIVCAAALKPGGVIVLDDSGLTSNYEPPAGMFQGHEGPSRVASRINTLQFKEILQVGHNRVFLKLPVLTPEPVIAPLPA